LTILSWSRIIGPVIATMALIQAGAAITQGVQAYILKQFSVLATKAFVSCTIWLGGSAACDVTIAVCMTFVLLRNSSGLPASRAVISRIVRLVVETGCLTALAAITDLTLFLVFTHKSYHGTVALTLAKLYSNSLLVLFNNRLLTATGRCHSSSSGSGWPSNIDFVFAKGGDVLNSTRQSAPIAFMHTTATSSIGEIESQARSEKPNFEESSA